MIVQMGGGGISPHYAQHKWTLIYGLFISTSIYNHWQFDICETNTLPQTNLLLAHSNVDTKCKILTQSLRRTESHWSFALFVALNVSSAQTVNLRWVNPSTQLPKLSSHQMQTTTILHRSMRWLKVNQTSPSTLFTRKHTHKHSQ